MVNLIRIGFDDEQVRSIVSVDFAAAGFLNTIVGAWKPGELRITTDIMQLQRDIKRISADVISGVITVNEGVARIQKAAYGY
jgi:hypothetical protein